MDPVKDTPISPEIPSTATPANVPTAPGAIPAPPIPPPAAPITAMKPEVTQAGGSSKKPMMIALIIVLVIAILGVGGFYAYQMMGAQKEAAMTESPAPSPDDSNKDLRDLSTQVENVNISDPSADMSEVDQQINTLDSTASASPSTATPPGAVTGSAVDR